MELEERTEDLLEAEERPTIPFYIDQQWYDAQNLSFHDLVLSRMCETCQARAAAREEEEERHTVYDSKNRRASLDVRRRPFASNPTKRSREDFRATKGARPH